MIIENERDERAAAWLLEKFGAEALAEAETRLKGSRRPYPGNLAKVLGGTPVREPETHRKRRSAPKTGRAAADVGREGCLGRFYDSRKVRPLFNAESANITDGVGKPRQTFQVVDG